MAASMILIVVPYVFVVLTFIGSMIGGETHWLDVSFGEEDPHNFYITCSNGSMGGDMATTTKQLFLYEVGHEIYWIPHDAQYLFIIYDMVWANLIHNVGEEIFGDLVFILPLEGNIIAA